MEYLVKRFERKFRVRTLTAVIALLSLIVAIAPMALAATGAAYKDVKAADWYYEAVTYCTDNGIIGESNTNGLSTGYWGPNEQMSRVNFVQAIANLAGLDVEAYADYIGADSSTLWYEGGAFLDVLTTYAPYVYWGVNNDIIKGVSETRFSPYNSITREQMATIFIRYLTYKGAKLPDAPGIARFTDAAKISDWAREGVDAIRMAGLLVGDPTGLVSPQKAMTRAEAATVLMRLHRQLKAQGVDLTEGVPGGGASAAVPVTGVTATITKTTLKVGETAQVNAVYAPVGATYKGLAYGTDSSVLKGGQIGQVVTVSADGLVTAIAPGTVTIYVVATNRQSNNVGSETFFYDYASMPHAVFEVTVEGEPKVLVTVDDEYIRLFNEEFGRLLNEARRAEGKLEADYDPSMQRGVNTRAEESLIYFEHKRPDGSSIMTAFDYEATVVDGVVNRSWSYIENLYLGPGYEDAIADAGKTFESWMNSPGHRATLLSSFSHTGGGRAAYGYAVGFVYYVLNDTDVRMNASFVMKYYGEPIY
jgi:hypothetical protein